MSFKYQHSADWFSLHSGCSRAAHVAFIYLLPGLSGAQWVPAWGIGYLRVSELQLWVAEVTKSKRAQCSVQLFSSVVSDFQAQFCGYR